MKFKAKETSKNKITNEIWIIQDKIYDLKEDTFYNEEYIFKSEVSDHHHVPKKDLCKWFEPVEEVKKPRICEILGVEVGEKFNIKYSIFSPFKLMNDDGFELKDRNNQSWSVDSLIKIINNPEWIEKLPKWTDEEKEILKALKVLGFGWIARDNNSNINFLYAFSVKPYKKHNVWINEDRIYTLNEKLFSFIKWEDKEPFEIPNIQ